MGVSAIMRYIRSPITEIQMVSNAAECSRLRKVVSRLALAALNDAHAVADLELAIGEAFSNAVKYGAHDAKVSVRVESSFGHRVMLEMAYPGSRFDTRITLPSNTAQATGGYGRFLMRNVTDSMEYSFRNGCTTLRMTKRR
jgi:anti-sigma regulatory factor (Ser/Thr protein kinase)